MARDMTVNRTGHIAMLFVEVRYPARELMGISDLIFRPDCTESVRVAKPCGVLSPTIGVASWLCLVDGSFGCFSFINRISADDGRALLMPYDHVTLDSTLLMQV
jgi:hypothetical protein